MDAAEEMPEKRGFHVEMPASVRREVNRAVRWALDNEYRMANGKGGRKDATKAAVVGAILLDFARRPEAERDAIVRRGLASFDALIAGHPAPAAQPDPPTMHPGTPAPPAEADARRPRPKRA